MWKAQDQSGADVWIRQADPAQTYFCRYKDAPVHELMVRSKDGHPYAFAHYPGSLCAWSTSEQTIRRNRMRDLVAMWSAYLPSPLGKSSLLLNQKFVLQLVTSPLSEIEWRQTTKRHNLHGNPVLWVFDIGLTDALSFEELEKTKFIRLPDALRICQHHSYNRLYLIDRHGDLRGCRFFKRKLDLYALGEMSPLIVERPAIGNWAWQEGYHQPLSRPLWHLHDPSSYRINFEVSA